MRRLVAPALGSVSSITFVGVVNERGDVVESLHEFAPTNILDREFFRTHERADTKRLLLSSPVLGRVSGRWAITLTRRINKIDGAFGGIAVISIEPRYLTEMFEATSLGPADVMSLVLTDGSTLARRRGAAISFGEDISGSQMMRELRIRPVGAYIGPGGLDGKSRVFAYRTMRDYPVVTTIGTLESDAFAGVWQRRRVYYGVAMLLTFLVGVGGIVGTQLLVRNDRAKHRLREQASLLDKAQDAILVTDLKRRVTYWNKSAERLYGWTADEALGKVVTDLLYPGGDAQEVTSAYDTVKARGEWSGDLLPQSRTGKSVVTESRWTLVRDAAGHERSILWSSTDVTDRRQLEQQFYRAQRLESIGTLAGGIAHDLNNVLAPIMLGMSMLRDRLIDDDSREILETISTSARRGAEMVSQVLSFARGQEGKRSEIRPCDLIADVVRIARDTLPKNIEIVTNADAALPAVFGDPTQCHQVLLNLCVNARDAMPNGGTLALSAETRSVPAHRDSPLDLAPGDYIVFRVVDSGDGIPAHLLDKIFDPFFTTKEAGKGTGLGLSTSLTIIRNHGGYIRVDSVPGKGTRFEVYLTIAAHAPVASPLDKATAAPRGGGQTVLVVDDEDSVRRVLRATLERGGYQVLMAANGKEALEVFNSGPTIDVVIMDMTMPVLGGVSTMRGMVRINPDVRIIAASGIHDNETIAKSIGGQVKQFLGKPFTSETVLRAVAGAVAGN